MLRTLLVCAFIIFTAASCGGSWHGETNKSRLQGTRISILAHEQHLKPSEYIKTEDIIVPEAEENASWDQVGGNTAHVLHNIKGPEELKKAWSASVGKGMNKRSSLLSEPVIADNTLFSIDSSATIYAIDAENGKKKWSAKLKPVNENDDSTIRGSGIAYGNNTIFATTGFADVIALNATNGEELWRTSLDSPIRIAPTVFNKQLFVIDINNTIVSLSTTDGHILWNYVAGTKKTSLLGGAAPAIQNNVVVATLSTGEIIALRSNSGSQLWMDALTARKRQDAISDIAAIRGRTAISGRLAYTIGHGGLMIATDMKTGRRIWEKEIGGINQPWVSGKYVYVISNEMELIALQATTGRIAWITELPKWEDEEEKEFRIMWTGPVMIQDKLIAVSSNGDISLYNPKTGDLISSSNIGTSISTPPIAANGALFILNDNANIIAYK
jgi:outer membrane protein assembly factor BamB